MGKHLILITCLASLVVAACVYKIDIQQGNVVTQKQVDQLRPGMTPDQVRYVLGTPLLHDSVRPGRWNYVYSMQPGGGARQLQHLTLLFDADDRLAGLHGDFRPHPGSGLGEPEVTTVEVPPRTIEKGIFELIGDLVRNLFS